MGRHLFKAPLSVLVAQARDTRVHLKAMQPVRDAFVAAGQDLASLEGELASALSAGRAAGVAREHVDERIRQSALAQQGLCERFRGWVAHLRAQLELAELSGNAERVRAAGEVRRLVPAHPGRRFSASLQSLRAVTGVLGRQADTLEVREWRPDLLSEALTLLASAETAAVGIGRLADERKLRTRERDQAALRLRQILRQVQSAWRLVKISHPSVPEMPLGRLRTYAERDAGLGAATGEEA